MDLNHIELPLASVTELYANTLIGPAGNDAPEKEVATSVKPGEKHGNTEALKSLGNNRKHILIAVNTTQAVFITDDELSFLTEILGACKLSLGDVALVNMQQHPDVSYKQLLTQFHSRIVLLFDIEPASLGLPVSFPHYQLQAFSGNTFLYAPSLKQLENDRVEKSKLWVCLKRLFNL